MYLEEFGLGEAEFGVYWCTRGTPLWLFSVISRATWLGTGVSNSGYHAYLPGDFIHG